MPLFTHSIFLKALGWSLISSIGQMAILWTSYLLAGFILKTFYRKKAAALLHGIAIRVLAIGTIWFVATFISLLFTTLNSPQNPPNDIRPFAGVPSVLPQTGVIASLLEQWLPFLSGVYLAVLFLLAIRYGFQYRQSGLLRHQGLHKADPGIRLFVDTTRRALGIQKKVSCWLSSMVESPLTIGFLRPVILLPIAISNNLDTRQVEAILLHELAHIKRNDYLLNLLTTIAGTLFFFNPFAKLLVQAIKKEREYCCDDWVLQFRYNPQSYASALLLLAKSHAGNTARPSFALAAAGGGNGLLLQRVKRILQLENDSLRSFRKPLAGLLVSLSATSILFFPSGAGLTAPIHPVPASQIIPLETTTHVFVSRPRIYRISTDRETVKTPQRRHFRSLTGKPVYANRTTPAPIPLRRTPAVAPSVSTGLIDAVAARPAEPRDFSIQLPADEPIPDGRSWPPAPGQPFVPGSSFSYKLTADNNFPVVLSHAQIAQAIRILMSIDWKMVEKQMPENGQPRTQKLLKIKTQVLKKIEELTEMYRQQLPHPALPSPVPTDSTRKPGQASVIIVYI